MAQTAIFAGTHKVAHDAAAAGLVLANEAADNAALVGLYSLQAISSMYLGDFPVAKQALQAGEALARERAHGNELLTILVLRAQILFNEGADVSQTKALLAEAESVDIKAGSKWSNVTIEFILARLTGLLGDIEKARVRFAQSAENARKTGNMRVVYSCQSDLAHILRRHGDLDEALALYR